VTDIRALLERDAEDLPPSRVDPYRALVRARRIRRRRRWAGAGSAAAVLVAALVGGLLWAGRPGPPVPAAPARFDPLTSRIALGWTPAHLTHRTTEITRTEQDLFYREGDAPAGTAGLAVRFLAAGQPHGDLGQVGLSPGATPRAAAPVRGRPAYCLVGGNGTTIVGAGACTGLRWEYAPGAWAQVSYHSADPAVTAAQASRIVRRVAEHATLSAHDAVRVPFRLTGAAAGLTVTRSLVDTGSPASAELQLTGPGNPAGVDLLVEVPGRPADLLGDNPVNTTVDGHPASAQPGRATLTVYDVSGAAVRVSSGGTDLTATYHQVQVVPRPADPATWTSPTG
jgi:hypothetical protein